MFSGWLSKLRKSWRGRGVKAPAAGDVILHDPARHRPHDLDDPFFDASVQARMGETIARAATSTDKPG